MTSLQSPSSNIHTRFAGSPTSEPLVSVVIPVRNGGVNFQRCLAALRQCDPPPHEVIVVDDGSTDGAAQTAREWGASVLSSPGAGGPARARNLGARRASGSVLLFVDADVALHPDAVGRVARHFASDAHLSAVFGSYDDAPGAANFLSQYKNLFHHYVHQSARADASTFWAGCGAIRREVFLAMGGFDEAYARPAIEDIELGYRLKAAGHGLRLDKQLLGAHLKRWTLRSLLRSDILDRGAPWTELILRDGAFVNDLNLQTHNRVSVVTLYLLVAALAAGLAGWLIGWLAAVGLAIVLLLLNLRLYRFFAAKRGLVFALGVVPMHWLYYSYNGLSFALGLARHLRRSPEVTQAEKHWEDAKACPRRVAAQETLLILGLSLVITLSPVGWVTDTWTPQGDEPHYLLAAHSLVYDGDLDLADNYARNDQWPFYPHLLDPHVRTGVDGRSYLSHDIGLSILIAPTYALAGYAGVVAFLAVVAALVAVNVYLLAFEATAKRSAALMTWLALALAPLLSVYAYLVYPEMIGALAVIWSVRQLLTSAPRVSHSTQRASRNTHSVDHESILSGAKRRRRMWVVVQRWFYGVRMPWGVSLAIALLPWLSARFIPIAAFLALLAAWRAQADRRRAAVAIGVPLLSLLGYFAVGAWMSGGGGLGAIDFSTRGFQGFSLERVARGLAGWWLDQQRGVLIYGPVYIAAFVGLPHLWRPLRWRGVALLAPLLIAWGSAAGWGGFWVGWEFSARYLVVGLPLLAAPLALAWTNARRTVFRGAMIMLLLISMLNTALVIRSPGLFAYRESIALVYDRWLPLDVWRVLPAMGGGGRVDPDPDAPSAATVVVDGDHQAWHVPAGPGGVVIQSAALNDLTVGSYHLEFEARAANTASPDAPLLSVDVFTGEGVLLLHRVIAASGFTGDDAYVPFAVSFQSPFYNKWSYPIYAQITSSGLADVWVSTLTVTVDESRTWGVTGVWAAALGLAIVAFGRPDRRPSGETGAA